MVAGPDRVVGIGQATVDLIGVAPRTTDALVEMSTFSVQGGGATATAMATVAALGGRATWFGRVSDDAFGKMILGGLRGFGVDVGASLIERNKVSPLSFINVDEQTRRRTVMFTRGDVTPLAAADIPAGLLAGARALFVDGHHPDAQAEAAERARAAGVTVVLDAAHLGKGIGELLALSDVVIASERFAADVAPSGEIEDSLIELQKMGPRIVVLTMGEAGAVALEGETLVRQKVIDVAVTDTTGAGDVFCGAFTYGLLRGWTLERCVPFANAAAGLKCRSLGGQAGIPSLDEVLRAAHLTP